MPARHVLGAVLWILNTGAQWHMLPQCHPSNKTVHRRFQQWGQQGVSRAVLADLANALRKQGDIDERDCFIDATFAAAKGGGDAIGPTKRGKDVKIMAIVDRHGLPLSVSTHAANLIGDNAYDSEELDAPLQKQWVEMIAPHRSNRKLKTQDGRRLQRYERRWLVERYFAWLPWKRRILIRWE